MALWPIALGHTSKRNLDLRAIGFRTNPFRRMVTLDFWYPRLANKMENYTPMHWTSCLNLSLFWWCLPYPNCLCFKWGSWGLSLARLSSTPRKASDRRTIAPNVFNSVKMQKFKNHCAWHKLLPPVASHRVQLGWKATGEHRNDGLWTIFTCLCLLLAAKADVWGTAQQGWRIYACHPRSQSQRGLTEADELKTYIVVHKQTDSDTLEMAQRRDEFSCWLNRRWTNLRVRHRVQGFCRNAHI